MYSNIEVISLVQYPDLYARMRKSAIDTATLSHPKFSSENGAGSGPHIASTYNKLGDKSDADILIFCHDDVEFISTGWDAAIIEAFLCVPVDVLGVIGSTKYGGGCIFDSGCTCARGKVQSIRNGERCVKVASGHYQAVEPVQVLDGMFLAVRADHFKENRFDENLDGLWFYDLDLCLRSRCGIVDILVSHNKPEKRVGVYPKGMPEMVEYTDYFYGKHDLKAPEIVGDQRVMIASMEEYDHMGQNDIFSTMQYIVKKP